MRLFVRCGRIARRQLYTSSIDQLWPLGRELGTLSLKFSFRSQFIYRQIEVLHGTTVYGLISRRGPTFCRRNCKCGLLQPRRPLREDN